MKKIIANSIMAAVLLTACTAPKNVEMNEKKENSAMNYTMPAEDLPHEGTWLTWPHSYTYGIEFQDEVEDIWVQMAAALHTGERVHIVAYDKNEQMRITEMLTSASIDMAQIDFVLAKSDDVWVRDTGPMFVFNQENKLVIADFAFDGWGGKAPYENDDYIPLAVGKQKNIETVAIPDFILEGGAVELDGNGTLMAAKSSVVSKNRNSELTIKQAEEYLSCYLGVRSFIWLDGVTDEDITDAHIDGSARFLDDSTILTVSKRDFAKLYENINMDDYIKLENAKNAEGASYELIELPLTKEIVEGADCYGSYLNYYIGNQVVLVPVYDDENDQLALEIIEKLYPGRQVVPIVVNDLFQYGGMLHCVTQQQPRQKN